MQIHGFVLTVFFFRRHFSILLCDIDRRVNSEDQKKEHRTKKAHIYPSIAISYEIERSSAENLSEYVYQLRAIQIVII